MTFLKPTLAALALAGATVFSAASVQAQTFTDEHYAWCMEQHGEAYDKSSNTYPLKAEGRSKACSSPYDDADTVADDGTVSDATYDANLEMDDTMKASHVEWCTARFPSYSVATNTYKASRGQTKACSSPYN